MAFVNGSEAGDIVTPYYIPDFIATWTTNTADTVEARGGDDLVYAGDGDDTVFGSDGEDQLFGEGGNDTLQGDNGDDHLDGGEGSDILNGGDGDDSLLGWDGDDYLMGGSGNDAFLGWSGNDILYGGEGADVLSSGSGKDTFLYMEAEESQSMSDFLYFDQGSDVIDVRKIDANPITFEDDPFTSVNYTGTFSAPGQIIYSSISNTTYVSFNTDYDQGAEMQIKIAGVLSLSLSDFYL